MSDRSETGPGGQGAAGGARGRVVPGPLGRAPPPVLGRAAWTGDVSFEPPGSWGGASGSGPPSLAPGRRRPAPAHPAPARPAAARPAAARPAGAGAVPGGPAAASPVPPGQPLLAGGQHRSPDPDRVGWRRLGPAAGGAGRLGCAPMWQQPQQPAPGHNRVHVGVVALIAAVAMLRRHRHRQPGQLVVEDPRGVLRRPVTPGVGGGTGNGFTNPFGGGTGGGSGSGGTSGSSGPVGGPAGDGSEGRPFHRRHQHPARATRTARRPEPA